MMNWSVPNHNCRHLVGLRSDGRRVVCGKKVLSGIVGQERCPEHSEFQTPAMVSFQLRADLAELIASRAEAYGVKASDLLTRLVENGIKMNMDAPQ
jgi:hypothetical protein